MASINKLTFVNQALTASATSDAQSLNQKESSFIGFLNVSANDGATTVNAKIQHSPDKVNWIDLCTFTAVVNTTGVQAVHEGDAGFTKRQLFPNVRSVVTLAGTPSATVEVSLWFDPQKG